MSPGGFAMLGPGRGTMSRAITLRLQRPRGMELDCSAQSVPTAEYSWNRLCGLISASDLNLPRSGKYVNKNADVGTVRGIALTILI